MCKLQLEDFIRERMVERTKPIDEHIQRNELKILGQPNSRAAGNGKQLIKSLLKK